MSAGSNPRPLRGQKPPLVGAELTRILYGTFMPPERFTTRYRVFDSHGNIQNGKDV